MVDAQQYDGSFALDFLRDGESIRAARDGSGMEVSTKTHKFTVPLGYWLVRHEDDGLSWHSEEKFVENYEPEDVT
jgi:hypothetical protein